MSPTATSAGAPAGCGSHTATAVPDEARGNLYIYNGGSSGTCTGIDIVRDQDLRPDRRHVSSSRPHGRPRQCHDNNVLLNVGGTNQLRDVRGRQRHHDVQVRHGHDRRRRSPGRHREPDADVVAVRCGVGTGHSGSFTYDGKTLSSAMSRAAAPRRAARRPSTVLERARCSSSTPQTGDDEGPLLHPRPQTSHENCTWHNFNAVPTKGGNFAVVRQLPVRHLVFDFTQPGRAEVIAFADPKPLPTHHLRRRRLSGRRRLVDLLVQRQDLRVRHLPRPDDVGPRQLVHQAREHGRVLQPADADRRRSRPTTSPPTVTSTNEGARLPAGLRADGGVHVRRRGPRRRRRARAPTTRRSTRPRSATTRTRSRRWTRPATHDQDRRLHGQQHRHRRPRRRARSPATLALTMGAPAQFGAFTPGVAREYTATTTANVISTAGDATLSVADPSPTNTGRLVNGTFALPSRCRLAPAPAARRGAGGRRRLRGADVAADLHRPGLQRRR